jgi:hypothetical protein
MTAMARTPVLPEATPVGVLSGLKRHSPRPRRQAYKRDAGSGRSAVRVSAALLEFPLSICAATSAQNTKRFFDRARLALRCSVSAISRASASPCRSRSCAAAAGAFMKCETRLSLPFAPPLSAARQLMTRCPRMPDPAPSPRLRLHALRAYNATASRPRSYDPRAWRPAPPRRPAPAAWR